MMAAVELRCYTRLCSVARAWLFRGDRKMASPEKNAMRTSAIVIGGTKGTHGVGYRISVQPQVHFGKPCVAGTRIPVQAVLELLRDGISSSEISRDYYPDLEPEDVRACIQHAIDVLAAEEIGFAP